MNPVTTNELSELDQFPMDITESEKAMVLKKRKKGQEKINSKVDADVVLRINGKDYHADRKLLIRSCEYFQTMFNNFGEGKEDVVPIEFPVTRDVLLLLQVIYAGYLEKDEDADTILRIMIAPSNFKQLQTFLGFQNMSSWI